MSHVVILSFYFILINQYLCIVQSHIYVIIKWRDVGVKLLVVKSNIHKTKLKKTKFLQTEKTFNYGTMPKRFSFCDNIKTIQIMFFICSSQWTQCNKYLCKK
jgi:hypothetical protein